MQTMQAFAIDRLRDKLEAGERRIYTHFTTSRSGKSFATHAYTMIEGVPVTLTGWIARAGIAPVVIRHEQMIGVNHYKPAELVSLISNILYKDTRILKHFAMAV